MRNRVKTLRACAALLLLVTAGACSGEESGTLDCTSDEACTIPGTRCDLELERCVCVTDEACPDGNFCNAFGSCQRRTGCAVNADCSEGRFCDIESGICLDAPEQPSLGSPCGLASHCPYGAVCAEGKCAEGCFDDGDCTLAQICYEGYCTVGGPGETICSGPDYCEYGQSCDNFLCEDDNRGPYCRTCSQRTSMNPNPCDGYRNFCLVNAQELGGVTNFCGVDCSQGQGCPSGYSCNDVIVLTRSQCGRTADCRCDPSNVDYGSFSCTLPQPCDPRLPGGEPDPNAQLCVVEGEPSCGDAPCYVPRGQNQGRCGCAVDTDCANDGVCVEGFCCTGEVRDDEALECVGGEGRVTGYCTCATDDDCGRDSCEASSGTCLITGFPCTPGNNDCPALACVNGGCFIGQNCAPEQGLSCSVVGGR